MASDVYKLLQAPTHILRIRVRLAQQTFVRSVLKRYSAFNIT